MRSRDALRFTPARVEVLVVGVALVNVFCLLTSVEVVTLFWFLLAALARGDVSISLWIAARTGGCCYACAGVFVFEEISVLLYALVERNA